MPFKVPLPAALTAALAIGSIYAGDAPKTSELEDQINKVFPATDSNTSIIDKVIIPDEIADLIDESIDLVVPENPIVVDVITPPVVIAPVVTPKTTCGFLNRVKPTDPTPDYLVSQWNKLFTASGIPVQRAMGGQLARNTKLSAIENGVKNMANHIEKLNSMLRQGAGKSGREGLQERKKRLRERAGQHRGNSK